MGGFDKTFDFEGYLSYYPAGERPRFSYLLVSRTGLLANGIRGTPNPYGPILLELDPEALTDCVDVAICLRSASGAGFDRVREALRNVAEVTRLFRWPGDPQILDRWGLQAAFPDQPPDQVRTAELSCAVRNGILSFEHLRLVRVDPYVILGTPLIQFVEQTARNSASPTRVFERDRFVADQRMVLEALGEALTDYPATLDDFADGSGTPLSAWAEAMRERGMYPAFCDYAGYLRRGTLLPVANATDVICEHRYAVALDDDICPECGELVY
jgi:hypothetical protein